AAGAAAWALRPDALSPAPDADAAAAAGGEEASASASLVARATAAPTEAPVARGRSFVEGVVRRLGEPAPARVEAWLQGRPGALVPASRLEVAGGADPH